MNQPGWQLYSLAEISTPASPSLAFGFGVDHRRISPAVGTRRGPGRSSSFVEVASPTAGAGQPRPRSHAHCPAAVSGGGGVSGASKRPG